MDTVNEYGSLACTCSDREPKTKTNSDGRVVFGMQCINCGSFQPKRKDSFTDLPTVAVDKGIAVEFAKRREQFYHSRRNQKKSEWFDWYSSYLNSPQWQSKRQAVLKRDRYLCQGCMVRRASQVHHLTYEHCGNELLWELTSVCEECHRKIHPHMQEVEIDWENFR